MSDISLQSPPTWNVIQNALGNLTLNNGAFATSFNQTSPVTWSWANITLATGFPISFQYAASATGSLSMTVSVGDMVLVFVNNGNGTLGAVTDNGTAGGNSYTQGSPQQAVTGRGVYFYTLSATKTATTISCSGSQQSMCAIVITGGQSLSIGATHTNSASTSGTAIDAVTTTAAGSLVVACFQAYNPGSFTILTGTLQAHANAVTSPAQTDESLITTVVPLSGTSVTSSGTYNNTPNWQGWSIEIINGAGTATNNSSPIWSLGGTYYNGSTSANDTWTLQNVVGTLPVSPTSQLTLSHTGSPGKMQFVLNTVSLLLTNSATATAQNISNLTLATASVSQSSPFWSLDGQYWNGSGSAPDSWLLQNVVANGTNGSSVLNITHLGTAGAAIVQVPALTSTGAVLSNFAGSGASLNYQMGATNIGIFGNATSHTSGWVQEGVTQFFVLAGNQPGIQFEQTRNLLWNSSTGVAGGTYTVGLGNPGYNCLSISSGSNSAFTNSGGLSLWQTDFSGNLQLGQLVMSLGLLGALTFVQITTPAAPTVSKVSGSGAQTWGYKVVAKDSGGNVTAASTEGTVTAQNATLSAAAINKILITRQFGAVTYDIYRTTAGTSPSTTGKIATINQNLAAANLVVFDAGSLVLSQVANASGGNTVYTGTITNGATNNGYVGCIFVVSGFTNGVNNGTFTCVASSTTTLTLSNAAGVAETHAGTAAQTGDSTTAPAVNTTGRITNYSGDTLVSNGVPSILAQLDPTAQSAAITATNLIASAPRTGMYRISWSAAITTAGTSSTLGGANGFQAIYTSPTDSVVKTTVAGNSVTSTANTTGTAIGGSLIVYAKTGTAIQYTFGYTSSGTAMVYELHIKVEAL